MSSTTDHIPHIADRGVGDRRARRRRALAGALIVAAAIGIAWPERPVAAADPAPRPEAVAALDWLSGQLAANGGTIPGFSPGSTDWGVTADAVLAFVAAGMSDEPAAITATDRLAEAADLYTTWAPTMPEVRVAGATAKTLLALAAMGRPTSVGGVDLEGELRALMVTSGPQTGRFADRVPDPTWDASNGFGQALSLLALSLTADGAPLQGVQFLLAQQCPSGGFRLTYGTDAGCTSDDAADSDTTALALQALLAADRTPEVRDALDRGLGWLLSIQDAATGAFGGTGPTAGLNTNSTGLIAQTLRAAGLADAADRAADWIVATAQLTGSNASGTPAAAHVGAIAYNPAARSAALSDGLPDAVADQWRRATTQAVLALRLAPYGPQVTDPVDPPVTTSTTSTSTTTTTPPTTVTSTTVTSTAPPTTTSTPPGSTPSTTAVATSVPAPPTVPESDGSEVLDTSAERGSAGAGGLAFTGSDPTPALAGAAAVALGIVLLAGSRSRRVRR